MELRTKKDSESAGASEHVDIRVLVVDANTRRAAATRRALKAPPTPFIVSPSRQIWSAAQILSGVPIDVVLLSLELAEADAEKPVDAEEPGFSGLRKLQAEAEEQPILVVGDDRERGSQAIQAGAADFLYTPAGYDPEMLRQRTLEVVKQRRAAERAAATSEAAHQAAPMQILLVDEEALVLRLLRRNLERRGHRVTAFQCPHKALSFAKSASFGFDLLICDERLGGMEGKRLSHLLRRYAPTLRALYFCSLAPSSAHEKFEAAGRAFYLLKPYALSEFGQKLEAIESRYPWPETRGEHASIGSFLQ